MHLYGQSTPTSPNACFHIVGTPEFSFGTIDQTETVEHTVIFKNDCDHAIEIASAKSSCGCTATVLRNDHIAHDGESQIQIRFTPPKGSNGKVLKTVSVYLRGEDQPHTTIRFSAFVQPDISLSPKLITIDTAYTNSTVKRSFKITNVGDRSMEILIEQPTATLYRRGRTGSIDFGNAFVTRAVHLSPDTLSLEPNETKTVELLLIPDTPGKIMGGARLTDGKNELYLQFTCDIFNATNAKK